MDASDAFLINGRFLMQPVTGVQRVAREMLRALDALPELPGRWTLLAPAQAEVPSLKRITIVRHGGAFAGGHPWEQRVLPGQARRGDRIVNFAGSGPWLGGPQVSWLHDAAVFDHAQAYTRAFVAWYRALFRQRLRRGDLLVTPSRHARDRLAYHLRVPPARIAVLAHGADHLDRTVAHPGVLERLRLRHAGYWLCVASANPTKNLQRLLNAHASLGADALPLVMVGDNNPRVFAAARCAGSAGSVLRVGRVDDPTLKALLQGARALLMPSLDEGFGLPAAEALRLGCAVVAARAGALPEVCGDAALYVDPGSVDGIAAAMASLAADDTAVAEWQAAGRHRAASMTWQATAEGLLHLLQEGCQA